MNINNVVNVTRVDICRSIETETNGKRHLKPIVMEREDINALRYQDKLNDAVSQINTELVSSMSHGSEVELNSFFTLQMHTEEDLVTLIQIDDWTEVADVLIDDEGKVTFDVLDEEFSELFE